MTVEDGARTLVADVRNVTGKTAHSVLTNEGPAKLPDPVRVKIQRIDGGYFLSRFDEKGECIGDTWHATVAEAKWQAELEYEITNSEWTEEGR